MNIGEILSRAWNIIWKNKILWLFGLFGGLGSASGGGSPGSGVNYQMNNSDFPNRNFPNPTTGDVPAWMERILELAPLWIALFVIGILLLIIVSILLSTFGKIGLARGAWAADEGTSRLSFGELFDYDKRYFLRVLGLVLLVWAIGVALGLLIVLPSIGLAIITFGIGLLCLIPLLCVLGIFLWALSMVADLAVIGIVNEDLGVMEALSRAWSLVKAQPVNILIMVLILWIGSLVAGFIIGIPALLVIAPMVAAFIANTDVALRGGTMLSLGLLCLYLPIAWLAGSILRSYVSTAWVVIYRRLTGRTAGLSQASAISYNAPNL